MKKSLIVLVAVCAPLGILHAQATGADSPTVATQPDAATDSQTSERAARAERPICRRIETTGQRIGTRRVCMTAAEWRRNDR